MGIVIAILAGIVLASIILALASRRPYTEPRRLSHIIANIDPTAFNRFRMPGSSPREAMENLNQEIKANRRRVARSSHRLRPR